MPAAHQFGAQPDAAARFAVLACVVEEVAENLGQPYRVDVQMDRLGRQCDGHLMLGTLGQRAARVDALIDHRRQFDTLPLEFNSALADAAHVAFTRAASGVTAPAE